MTFRITREALLDGSMLQYIRREAEKHPDMIYRTEAEMAALLERTLSEHEPGQDLFVFGYGSLMWNPAFHYVDRMSAVVHGWHRRFCLKLVAGRGSPETPGLMLALDRGGSCKGVAFQVSADAARDELDVLWRREMYGGAYDARWVMVRTPGGRQRALTFVVNRNHPRYVPELGPEDTIKLIATGCGRLGSCREYLENTVKHLEELGMHDRALTRIVRALPKQ